MDLQPKVSTTPPHAFAAVSTAPPQRHGPGTPVYLQLPATTFSPAPPSTNYVPVLRGRLPGWNYMEVVVGSNLCFLPLFFFFFVGQGGHSAAESVNIRRGDVVSRPALRGLNRNSAPSSGTTCSLELSLPSPAGIWFKTPLPVGGTNTPITQYEFRGRECGGHHQPEGCGIPTKPAGGLLSDLGKVAPALGWAGVPYRTALMVLYVPPCAPLYTLLQAPARATISTVQQE